MMKALLVSMMLFRIIDRKEYYNGTVLNLHNFAYKVTEIGRINCCYICFRPIS